MYIPMFVCIYIQKWNYIYLQVPPQMASSSFVFLFWVDRNQPCESFCQLKNHLVFYKFCHHSNKFEFTGGVCRHRIKRNLGKTNFNVKWLYFKFWEWVKICKKLPVRLSLSVINYVSQIYKILVPSDNNSWFLAVKVCCWNSICNGVWYRDTSTRFS